MSCTGYARSTSSFGTPTGPIYCRARAILLAFCNPLQEHNLEVTTALAPGSGSVPLVGQGDVH